MKKNMKIYELELSRETLTEISQNIGLLDNIDLIYSNYQEYGYTNILDFAIDELSQITVSELLEYINEYTSDLKFMLDNAYENY